MKLTRQTKLAVETLKKAEETAHKDAHTVAVPMWAALALLDHFDAQREAPAANLDFSER